MTVLMKAHPDFEHPERGNTNSLPPGFAAGILIDAKREADISEVLRVLPDDTMRLQLAAGWVTALAERDKLDEAKRVVDEAITPLQADAGHRLANALAGKFEPPPALPKDRHGRATGQQPPGVYEVIEAENAIARATAKASGDSTAAGEAGIGGAIGWRLRESGAPLKPYEWADLACEAAAGGHREQSNQAIERALDAMKHEQDSSPAEIERTSWFVREAMQFDDGPAFARDLLNTTAPPGAWEWYWLATHHAKAGNAARAHEFTENAIQAARTDKGGETLAQIAVDLNAAGERDRAASLFLEAIDHIDGEDFGIGGTEAVVYAALQMNRLDLLDQLYEKHEDGNKLLISAIAASLSDPANDPQKQAD